MGDWVPPVASREVAREVARDEVVRNSKDWGWCWSHVSKVDGGDWVGGVRANDVMFSVLCVEIPVACRDGGYGMVEDCVATRGVQRRDGDGVVWGVERE